MNPPRRAARISAMLLTFLAFIHPNRAEFVKRATCSSNVTIAESAEAYTPRANLCTSDFQLVRNATFSDCDGTIQLKLNSAERDYISSRESDVLPDTWGAYLENVVAVAEGVDLSSPLPDYVSQILSGSACGGDDSNNGIIFPRLGIAVSGGGYRASTFGAGVLNALDGRNDSAALIGTGGLLQAASYLTGLSGGSWLVTSAVQAGFPTMQDVVFGPSEADSNSSVETGTGGGYGGWNAEYDIFDVSNDTATLDAFLAVIVEEMASKYKAGYPVTFGDLWARVLSRHFVNGTHEDEFLDECSTLHGAGITWSQVANMSGFKSYEIPYPIIVVNSHSKEGNSNEIESGEFVPLTNSIYEFSPYEMGSFDPSLSAFIPTEYIGSVNDSVCVTGYDQIAYVTGASSALFNEYNSSAAALEASSVGPLFDLINATFPQSNNIELDVVYFPNPFQGINPSAFLDSNETYLRLVDGGEDGEVVPLQPLLVQARGIDTIIAIDASSDLNDSFTGGGSMISTKNRTTLYPGVYAFPDVPSTIEEFVADGLTTRPTFFGCNDSAPVPLVVYIANGGPARGEPAITNTSTSQTTYTDAELQVFIDQTFDIATQGKAPEDGSDEKDPEFAACLACGIVDRARAAAGVERSGICSSCFERYCWYASY